MKGKVLVVDDDTAVRGACVKALDRLGYSVESVEDAREALAKLEKGSFDVLLTDLNMPGPDGVELTRRAIELYPDMDVIIMTGFPDYETAIATLREGAYHYLAKPVGLDSLRIVFERCFEKRKLAASLRQERTLRREIQRAYDKLREAREIKEDFVSIVSHELRTSSTRSSTPSARSRGT